MSKHDIIIKLKVISVSFIGYIKSHLKQYDKLIETTVSYLQSKIVVNEFSPRISAATS